MIQSVGDNISDFPVSSIVYKTKQGFNKKREGREKK
jgi:hypothetical protein